VVAGGGENGVDGVAGLSGEAVSVHAVAGFEMADDWLDGGAALDLGGDAPFLSLGEDLEPIGWRRLVALVAGVGGAAFGRGQRVPWRTRPPGPPCL